MLKNNGGAFCRLEVEKSDWKRMTDVTQLGLFGREPYLPPILSLYSRETARDLSSDRPAPSTGMGEPGETFQSFRAERLILRSDRSWRQRISRAFGGA